MIRVAFVILFALIAAVLYLQIQSGVAMEPGAPDRTRIAVGDVALGRVGSDQFGLDQCIGRQFGHWRARRAGIGPVAGYRSEPRESSYSESC